MICLSFFIIYICNVIISVISIEVPTTLGKVKGKFVADEITGANFYSFEGIPYAKPPVGNLRFKPPVKIEPWSTVFDATKPGRVCPQSEFYYSRKEMSEDCLNFNIYIPSNWVGKSLPVVFVIHGGDFVFLSGNAEPVYGPQLLIRNEVVVVTINYRLGALGFLSLCNEEVSGNAGIKDIILALKIVRENIWRFGGDPHKITIMGTSAGAVATQLLMLTNQTVGLFQQVITSSGSVLSTKFVQLNPRKNAIALGRELGVDLSNDDRMIDKLRNIDAFKIVDAQEAVARKDPQRGFKVFRPFTPTVEIEYAGAVITKQPLQMIMNGEIQDVPMLIGFTNQEGLEIFPLIGKEPDLINKLNKNFELLIPEDIQYPPGSAARRNLATQIREFYFDGGDISFVNVQNYINLVSDSQFTFAIDLFVKLFKAKKKAPVYYYIFASDTELNYFKAIQNITYPGAAHFDDIGYIFLTSITKEVYGCLEINTKRLQDNVLYDLKYFMYNGAPTPNPNVNCWPEAGKDRYHIIQQDTLLPVFQRPIPERIDFWTSVYAEFFSSKYYVGNYFCTKTRPSISVL